MQGGKLVREARVRARLTQRQLAEKAGVSQPTIARIESGAVRPSFDQVHRLVRACGLDLQIAIAPADDSDWSAAQGNLRLSPEARVRQHQAALRFIRAGREARQRARA
jgi:transcriptional regulator with XRE-family HTH domain